jgi:hypothetical protein
VHAAGPGGGAAELVVGGSAEVFGADVLGAAVVVDGLGAADDDETGIDDVGAAGVETGVDVGVETGTDVGVLAGPLADVPWPVSVEAQPAIKPVTAMAATAVDRTREPINCRSAGRSSRAGCSA